jgi:hypothetical protein
VEPLLERRGEGEEDGGTELEREKSTEGELESAPVLERETRGVGVADHTVDGEREVKGDTDAVRFAVAEGEFVELAVCTNDLVEHRDREEEPDAV